MALLIKQHHVRELQALSLAVQAFADIKNYYNDITHNNLDLIKALKADTTEMRKREVQNEKLMSEIAQENKRLTEPLTKVSVHQCLDVAPIAALRRDSQILRARISR